MLVAHASAGWCDMMLRMHVKKVTELWAALKKRPSVSRGLEGGVEERRGEMTDCQGPPGMPPGLLLGVTDTRCADMEADGCTAVAV